VIIKYGNKLTYCKFISQQRRKFVQMYYSHTLHESVYLMLKGDIAYILLFAYTDQAKLLQVEQKIVKSFRFI
jgi:hypothetical protein